MQYNKKGIRHSYNGKTMHEIIHGHVAYFERDPKFDPLLRKNPLHFRAFPIPAGVDITLHCNVRTGVSQQLTERLYVTSGLQTCCGKGVAQGVRIHGRHTRTAQIAAQAFAVAARLHRLVGIAG